MLLGYDVVQRHRRQLRGRFPELVEEPQAEIGAERRLHHIGVAPIHAGCVHPRRASDVLIDNVGHLHASHTDIFP